MNDWTVTPLAASLGARVDGVRLTDAGDVELGALQNLLDEHHVLVVSGQDEFSVTDQVRVGESLGTRTCTRSSTPSPNTLRSFR